MYEKCKIIIRLNQHISENTEDNLRANLWDIGTGDMEKCVVEVFDKDGELLISQPTGAIKVEDVVKHLIVNYSEGYAEIMESIEYTERLGSYGISQIIKDNQ